jgi:hypothetical protein
MGTISGLSKQDPDIDRLGYFLSNPIETVGGGGGISLIIKSVG